MQVSSLLSTDMFLPTECDVQRSVKRSLPPETPTVIAAVAAAIASSLIRDFCRPGSCAEKRSAVVVESVADERLFMRGEIVTENCDVIKFILFVHPTPLLPVASAPQVADRATRAIAECAHAGGDGLQRGENTVGVTLLFDQRAPHIFRAHAGCAGIVATFGMGAAPGFDEVAYIAQEMRQALLERFAPPQVSAIETDHAALQFTHPFANGGAVPAEFAFGEALPAGTEHFDRARHEDAALTAFQ
jgi:hypothetical protein